MIFNWLVLLLKVIFGIFRINGWLVWLPVCWTHFSVFVGILECLYETQGLIDRAPNRQVIDGNPN